MSILLNPGPVTLSPRVRAALTRPDMCHREPEFAALMLDLRRRLASVYPAPDYVAVLLTGSGTAAVEAMLASLAPRSSPTLVLTNGVYGQRMATMLRIQGKPVEVLARPWLSGLDLAGLEQLLESRPDLGHIAAVHHETTTGRLNDLPGLASLCARFQRRLLVDAVSSFGAEALHLEAPIVAVAATANKCLHGIPGLGFVMVRQDCLEAESHSPSLYLDLMLYAREQVQGFSPYTMAVQACLALQEALLEHEEHGGVEARRLRYLQLTTRVREALGRLGVEPLLSPADNSSMLTAYQLPALGYVALHDRLKQAGFTIYAGQGELAPSIFRIATMGWISDADLALLVATLEQLLS